MNLTVVISTYNREDKLRKCLESVKDIAGEIIVVDNTSSDNSVTLGKKYTKHVFVRKNNPMLNINKNFGISKATKDWILYLDDDEKLTEELREEITSIVNAPVQQPQTKASRPKDNQPLAEIINGYWLPRKNMIFGKWIQHTGWYPDYQMRLFKNGKGKYPEKHVHEMIQVDGETQRLTHPLEHDNYDTVSSFLQKTFMIYAPNEAENHVKNGYIFSFSDVLRFPTKEFVTRYFAQEGYKDGFHGLLLSLLMAMYHLVVFAFLWEYNNFPAKQISLQEFSREYEESKKEIGYWVYTKEIESETNSLRKSLLRIKRKLSV